MTLAILQTVLLLLTGLYFAWMVFQHLSTWFYFSRYDRSYPPTGFEPPVTIIKPIYGLDQSAYENFRSFCEQDYSNEVELLFCVEEPADPAIPVIERIIREFPDRKVRLIFSDPKDTRSLGKIKNTIAGLAEASHQVVIFSDSDVHAPVTFLRDMVVSLQRPEIGLGFGLQAFEGAENWAAGLMNLSVNELVLPVTTACLYGKFEGAIGTTMIMRREVIDQIGGLVQFGYQIVDDIPLARAIRAQGYEIHLLKQPIRVYHHRDRFRRWWSHMLRWQIIIRHYWPVISIINNLLPLGFWWSLFYLVISLVRGENELSGIFLISAVLATSLISSAIINLKFVRRNQVWRYLWVVPILEFSRLPLIVHSYLTKEVAWRGRKLRIRPDCTASLVETSG